MTPTVRNATEMTCSRVKRLPHSQPTRIVVTLPPLRKMMCTGTDILYPNAKLLRMLTLKKRTMFRSQRRIGMAFRLRKKGGSWRENWWGQANKRVRRNWVKVISSPKLGFSIVRGGKKHRQRTAIWFLSKI